jgi:5-methylthioadenosine/S-adenosylhomocysteine deaminase
MNRPCTLAITGATVLPFTDAWPVVPDCDVVVDDGRIVAIGHGAASDYRAARSIDARSLILIPGLHNAHTHSPEALARGRAEQATLDAWLRAVWPDLDALDDLQIERAVLLTAAESLHAGVTAIVDHFRQVPMSARAIAAAARAWRCSGLRTNLAIMVRDRGVPDWVPAAARGMLSATAQLALCEEAIRDWHGDRLRIVLGPSAPTRVSDALFIELTALARAAQVRVHMHVDETRSDADMARNLFGTTAIRHLDEIGALGPHLSLAHAVWASGDDIDRLAATGTGVVHNPVSNLRLGSGRMSIERFLERGVPVAIGTDGAASNDSQNVFEALKLALLLPRIAIEDPARWPAVRDALAMATHVPARMFGTGIGQIAVGAPADLAFFDGQVAPLLPVNDLHHQIAFAGAALSARHVIVGGEILLYDGKIQTFDEPALLRSVTHAALKS